jgi:molybdopterin synthase sulfur carrier subunit
MQIHVKFFASLREQTGKSTDFVESTTRLSVTDIWQQATGQASMPENTLCAINMEYVDRDALAGDGDEVAFFPPVTGGSK